MAQRLQELCVLFVEDNCGYLCSQIFNTLADNGRLSRAQLQLRLRIPSRKLRTALAVLVQQHLLLHYTVDDDTTFYQVDWRNAYYLIRSNRIITVVRERYGEGAGKVIANVLQLGHARVGDLAQAFDLESTAKRDSGIETSGQGDCGIQTGGKSMGHIHQTHDGKITTLAQFHKTLRNLLQSGFLIKFDKQCHIPAADLQDELEETVIREQFPDRKVSGSKNQERFRSAVNRLKRKRRDENDFSDQRDCESMGIIRRSGMDSVKRTKLNGGTHANGVVHDDSSAEGNVPKLPNDMILTVNYPQCTMALRSQRLEQTAEPLLGGVTASVYGALLQALEGKVRARESYIKTEENEDKDPENDLPTATTMEVADILDPSIDLTLGILLPVEVKVTNGDGTKKTKKFDMEFADIGIKQEIESDDEDQPTHNGHGPYNDRNKRLSLIEEHLKLLNEHPNNFCRKVGGGGRGEWIVDFPELTDLLIQAEIDSTVSARFGRIHTRLVRLLRERGRLDEKQIAALALMRLKDVRSHMTELQYAGFVEAQEIPKDNSRQPNRTIYLWFHDQTRVQSILLQHIYQGMARTLQRHRTERSSYKNLIDKAEMMDAKHESLAQNERDAIQEWRDIEEKLLASVQRMDEMVALLRDFSWEDTSLVA
ncbi:DNA-directed RNA polymerase III subunit rpc-3 [Lecanosticta acicola]|uniref:DNA-directed RNA polymerase III subunit RPC3 n=1 Tax=Lecanosticta acicola TaxID=111012 RepID=A0AAI8YU97_9PEZI|nr:DNA-directed RNA polymerase III subunit rpc-3 [Lecanosticta acicola]